MRELMTQDEIDNDRTAWLAARRDLITGTDMASILRAKGAYGSPVSVFLAKTAGIERPDSLRLAAGRDREQFVAGLFAGLLPDVHPGYISPGTELTQRGLCVHDDRPWQGATFDRIEDPDGALVEIKTSNIRDGFGVPPYGEVPLPMFIQCLWEADVAGRDLVKLVVFFEPGGPIACYWIRVDDEARADLRVFRDRADRFRTEYVLPGVMPPADGHRATIDALSRAFASLEEDTTVTVPAQWWRWALAAEQRRDEAAARLAELKAMIAGRMGNAALAKTPAGDRVLQRSLSWPRRVDLEQLRSKHPEVAEECTVERSLDEPVIRYLLKKPRKAK